MPSGPSTPRRSEEKKVATKKKSATSLASAFFGSSSAETEKKTSNPPTAKGQGVDLANFKVTGCVALDKNGQARAQLQLCSKSGLVSLTFEVAASAQGTSDATSKEMSGVTAAVVEVLLNELLKGKKGVPSNDKAAWHELCLSLGCPLLVPLYDSVAESGNEPKRRASKEAGESERKPRAKGLTSLPTKGLASVPAPASARGMGSARGARRSLTAVELAEAREAAAAAERERLERQAHYNDLSSDEKLMVQLETLAAEDKGFDAPLECGLTPLLVACRMHSVAGARFCLRQGADPSMAIDGKSPLLLAAQDGATELLYVLIQAGADVSAATADEGIAPVHAAVEAGNVSCLEMLLDFGADADQRDHNGCTPCAYCAKAKTWTAEMADCLRVLLDAGATPDKSDREGFSPLLLAVQKNHHECVQLLLDAGADAELADPVSGATACLLAVQQNAIEMCMHLLGAGADPHESGLSMRFDGTRLVPTGARLVPADLARFEGFDHLAELLGAHVPRLSADEVRQLANEKQQRQADRREMFGAWQQTVASQKSDGMTTPKHEALLEQHREAAAEALAAAEARGEGGRFRAASPTSYFGGRPGLAARASPELPSPEFLRPPLPVSREPIGRGELPVQVPTLSLPKQLPPAKPRSQPLPAA